MAANDDDELTPSSLSSSLSSFSLKKKVKFLCSHGGRILPRPSDGHLKYVGGETRVVAVPREITFSELKKRVSEMAEGEVVLKYQITIGEEDDILVSVKSDEDVRHMIQEFDRINNGDCSSPKLRAFLFPLRRTTTTANANTTNMHRVHSSPTLYSHYQHQHLHCRPPTSAAAPRRVPYSHAFHHYYINPSTANYNTSNNINNTKHDHLLRIVDSLPPSPTKALWD